MSADELAALTWRKSSASDNDDCVEVASAGKMIMVRDSKDRHGRNLVFSCHDWGVFVAGIRGNTADAPV